MDSHQSEVCLWGIPITDISRTAMVTRIVTIVEQREHGIIANINIHAINLAYEQPRVYQFFREYASIIHCDGYGVLIGARLMGLHIRQRMTSPDWIDALCEKCIERSYALFLLGARPGVAERAARNLQKKHPGLKIAGTHHGYFDKSGNQPENQQVIKLVNDAQPDILLVAFGMPLQELWLLENWDELHAGAAIPVGALFDYLAGEVRRPPRWMTDHGLEWFGRLFVEPGRLWRRYLIGNPLFFWRIFKYKLSIKPAHFSE